MFDLPAVQISTKDRISLGHGSGERWSPPPGLVLLIFALARTGRAALSAAAVGAYIGAAYWFTSSTTFANPAVTVGRIFSDTFAGIAPASAAVLHRRPARRRRCVGLGLVSVLLSRRRQSLRIGPSSRIRTTSHRRKLRLMSKPSVLFVCVHNAGRSQMAAGFLTHLSPAARSRSAPPAPSPPTRSTPPRCRPWPRSASTSPRETPKILTDRGRPRRPTS